MMRTIVIIGMVFCTLISVRTFQERNRLKDAEWLIGSWETKTKRGSVYESWERSGTSELMGKSFMIKESDTMVLETIRLVEEANNLYYIPTVNDQNDQQPVRFRLVTLSTNGMRFENKEHDFPQFIEYKLIHADSLVAEISGVKDGKMRGSRFPMKRVH